MIKGIEKVTRNHYKLLKGWYEERGLAMPKRSHFSTMGYIADGRVAGWLHLMNSDMALIEGLISDPNTIPSLRRDSVIKLCGFLTDTAIALGYPVVLGITKAPSIETVAQKLGYKELKGYKIMALDVSEEEEELA